MWVGLLQPSWYQVLKVFNTNEYKYTRKVIHKQPSFWFLKQKKNWIIDTCGRSLSLTHTFFSEQLWEANNGNMYIWHSDFQFIQKQIENQINADLKNWFVFNLF